MNNKTQNLMDKLRKKINKKMLFGIGAAVVGTGGVDAAMKYYDKEINVLHAETVSPVDNQVYNQLFTAAFENDVDGFKQALKKGANITFSNRHNQNALMIALSRESYDVCDYILATPELRDKIDYRQSDDEGVTATGIIDIKLRETKEIDNVMKLKKTKESIDDQLMKQLAGETKGQARSDTNYDAFSVALQNAIKKGNIEK